MSKNKQLTIYNLMLRIILSILLLLGLISTSHADTDNLVIDPKKIQWTDLEYETGFLFFTATSEVSSKVVDSKTVGVKN